MNQEPNSAYEDFLREIKANLLPIKTGDRILDIGIGTGRIWQFLSMFTDKLYQVYGVDIDERNLQQADQFIHAGYLDIEKAMTQAPFKLTTLMGVLEHVEDPLELLEYASSSERVFITVPNAYSLNRQVYVLEGIIDDVHDLHDGDLMIGHQEVYDHETIMYEVCEPFCKKHNFTPVAFGSYGFKMFPNNIMELVPEYKIKCLEVAARDSGFVGPGRFFGSELYVEMRKNG